MNTLQHLFSRRWWWVTLLVLAGMAVLVSLGNWQLDRRAQRRAANAILREQLAAEPVDLNDPQLDVEALATMPDRAVTVTGEFDFSEQIWLKLQNYAGQAGGHLVAPLRISGRDDAVLVDRGWAPYADVDPARWAQYDEPGELTLSGVIQLSDDSERATAPEGDSREWFRLNVGAIGERLPYDVLPVYVLQTGDDGIGPLMREQPDTDLSEGPHLSYAIQWFTFALMLGVGYVFYVRREERNVTDSDT